jgi:hypothetical protein
MHGLALVHMVSIDAKTSGFERFAAFSVPPAPVQAPAQPS